jgi:hypothetical protein
VSALSISRMLNLSLSSGLFPLTLLASMDFVGMYGHFVLLRVLYRDFIVGRILEISKEPSPGRAPQFDVKWFNVISLSIGASPALSEGNRRAVELDYSMVDGQAIVEVREALLYYVLKELGLGPFSSTSGRGTQIVLLNEAELSGYIQEAVSAKTVSRTAKVTHG